MSSKSKSLRGFVSSCEIIKPHAKPTLTPKLRFPEFRGAEGWKTTPLGELGAIVTGKTPSTKEDDLWGGEILFITPTDITEGEKYQHGTQRTVVETKGTKVLPPGSVVYTCIASIGKMALTVFPSVTNQQINAVEPNGKTAKEFIYYSLANLTPWIKSIPATSTLPIINKTQFSKFIIPHPDDKREQQKIAACLTTLDEVIAAQGQKIDALKTHKKGLMQQLFPREGETLPRLRFPEFQAAPEWEEDKLGSVCELYQPVTLTAADLTMTGEFLVYGANGIIGSHDEYNHEESEIAVTCRGATCGEVTTTKPQSWITGNAMVVKPRSKKMRKDFIFYYFKNHGLKTVISGSAQPQITRAGFAPLPISFPIPAEQQRIATCLTTLDDLITAQNTKLSALKTHKRGLMQQLFPAPTEQLHTSEGHRSGLFPFPEEVEA